jgi:hypothetical protein
MVFGWEGGDLSDARGVAKRTGRERWGILILTGVCRGTKLLCRTAGVLADDWALCPGGRVISWEKIWILDGDIPGRLSG